MQNRRRTSREMPRNRDCPVSAPRSGQTRCGETRNSVARGGGEEGELYGILRSHGSLKTLGRNEPAQRVL